MLNEDDPVAKAINEGENRYRQTVLSQGPLPGYPVIERTPPNAPRAPEPERCLHTAIAFETVTIPPSTCAVNFPTPPFQRTRCKDCGAILQRPYDQT